ncbi:hypothetical protein BC940DRAFT_344341 [Gongronella butleri]|nr:hypothetical protein BC940DRAFT_344341 [Gongronella butleri]
MYEPQYPDTLAGGHFTDFDYQFMLDSGTYRGDTMLDLPQDYLNNMPSSSLIDHTSSYNGYTSTGYPGKPWPAGGKVSLQEDPSLCGSDSGSRASHSSSSQEHLYVHGLSSTEFQSSSASLVNNNPGMANRSTNGNNVYFTASSSTPQAQAPYQHHPHHHQHTGSTTSTTSNGTATAAAIFPHHAFYASNGTAQASTPPTSHLQHYVSDAMYAAQGIDEYATAAAAAAAHQQSQQQQSLASDATPPLSTFYQQKMMDDIDAQQQQQQFQHLEQFYGAATDEQSQFFLMQQQQHQLWLQQQQQHQHQQHQQLQQQHMRHHHYPSPSYTTDGNDSRPQIYVRKACVACKQSHVACDVQRPCSRCVRLNKADSCVDAERKKRGRPCGSGKKKKEAMRDAFMP